MKRFINNWLLARYYGAGRWAALRYAWYRCFR